MSASLKPASPASGPVAVSILYDPDPDLPIQQHFSFPNGNIFPINDDSTAIAITISSPAGTNVALANPDPVVWIQPPLDTEGNPPAELSADGLTISFAVPKPSDYLLPWIFRVRINAELNGISSPAIYLFSPPTSAGEHLLNVLYDPSDGSFTLNQVIALDHGSPLTNCQFPMTLSFAIAGSPGTSIVSPGVVWNSGSPPPWVQPDSSAPASFTIAPSAPGNGDGLKLAIAFNGSPVLSPDPILINATLGDGT